MLPVKVHLIIKKSSIILCVNCSLRHSSFPLEKMYKKWPCINFTISSTPFIHSIIFLQYIHYIVENAARFLASLGTRTPFSTFLSSVETNLPGVRSALWLCSHTFASPTWLFSSLHARFFNERRKMSVTNKEREGDSEHIYFCPPIGTARRTTESRANLCGKKSVGSCSTNTDRADFIRRLEELGMV